MMQTEELPFALKRDTSAVPRQHSVASRTATGKRIRIPVFMFVVGLVVPWLIYLGPLRMSVYRLVLSITILPCLGMWLSGKAGRIRLADVTLLLFASWCVFSLVMNHGIGLVTQTAGIIFIETVGPYLLARCYIRDADDFYNVVQLLFKVVVLLLPFAVIEFVTGRDIARELFAAVLPTNSTSMPPRLGLTRVQTVFDHPILFGLFAGNLLSLVHLVLGYNGNPLRRSLRIGVIAGATVMSLSSGPLSALATQAFFLSWNSVWGTIRSRWKILVAALLSMYVVIDFAANRSPLQIFAAYFVLDPGSYWYRTWIFNYALESALSHPLYGVGLSDWERPVWMGSSIDNFWLYYAVKHGLPAVILLLLTCLLIFSSLGFKKGLDAKLTEYRTGFLITLIAFCLVGYTVHLWDAAYALFTFLMGSGMWLLDVPPKKGSPVELSPEGHGRVNMNQVTSRRTSGFAVRHRSMKFHSRARV